jgi:hypothetical protein
VSFAVHLVANLLFMPIFSGLRNLPLAAVDIVIVGPIDPGDGGRWMNKRPRLF